MPRGVDEADWKRAKHLAAKEGQGSNYVYIMRIYQKIRKGRRK